MTKSKSKTKRTQRPVRRNAGPPPPTRPRQPRAPNAAPTMAEDSPGKRLLYTAAGALGTSLIGSFLAREGWAPKPVAIALAASGAAFALKAADPTTRSVAMGAMSAAGSTLTLLTLNPDDKPDASPAERKPEVATAAPPALSKRNDDGLPPGALESAFARARARLALTQGEPIDITA